jgi:acetolactate synthase-1/2/3 large subunit
MTAREGDSTARGSDYLYQALVDSGVELLVGLPGTQTLPLDRTVAERSEMDYLMARHETAIPHIAWGYYEAGGGVAATLTVPGPGDTNSMHGLKNALEDCVPIVHVSADANPAERGKGPIHEIEPDTYDNVVKANLNVEKPVELAEQVERGIEIALTPPYGPVRLGVPSNILRGAVDLPGADVSPERVSFDNRRAYERAAALVREASRPVVYVGGGARRSEGGPRAVRELLEELDVPVVTSYKGKGVVPGDDPRHLGVTAGYLPPGSKRVLADADVVLALGTDFDGVTTGHWELSMGDSLVHVNLAADDIDEGYEADVVLRADVAEAVDALLERLRGSVSSTERWDGAAVAGAVQSEYLDHLDEAGLLAESSPAKTPAVLRALREVIPREAVVTTDIGGHRLWANEVFEAYSPETYVTAGSWAGMGVGLPAAVGAKMARPDRDVVTLTGDGGLMMCVHELHTAAERDLDVVTVVFNNSDYGIISKSPEIEDYGQGHRFQWSSPDFATVAEGFGCRATRVRSPAAAADAVEAALARADGPELIEVDIETEEPSVNDAADFESTVAFR